MAPLACATSEAAAPVKDATSCSVMARFIADSFASATAVVTAACVPALAAALGLAPAALALASVA